MHWSLAIALSVVLLASGGRAGCPFDNGAAQFPGSQYPWQYGTLDATHPSTHNLHKRHHEKIQSLDGSGNNMAHPELNERRYLRQHPSNYASPSDTVPGVFDRPNARNISNSVFSFNPYIYTDALTSDFLPLWGLFMHSDMTCPPRNENEPFHISVPQGDTVFDPHNSGTQLIKLSRGAYVGITTDPRTGRLDREYLNDCTSFMDASGLYGYNQTGVYDPRTYENGLLRSVQHPVLGEAPPVKDGFFQWPSISLNLSPHMTVPYILLLRDHNRRARLIRGEHPDWNDEQIFQRARRQVIALIQRITMHYYYSMRLGKAPPPYTRYNSSVSTAIDLAFSNVALRYGHTALNSMIWRMDAKGHPSTKGHLILEESFLANNVALILEDGIEDIIRGFASQPEQATDGHYVPVVRNKIPLALPLEHFDLLAITIQRGRDLGLADYNTMREAYGLARITRWEDVVPEDEKQVLRALKKMYPDVNNVDPYPGSVVEKHLDGSTLGPLSTAIIHEQLIRMRDGDRFWYENEGVLTPEELADVKVHGNWGKLVMLNTNITVFPENPFAVAVPDYTLGTELTTKGTATAAGEASITIPGILKLSWEIAGSNINFVVESNNDGWFGFGFGKDMLPADIYLFRHNTPTGEWIVQDSYSKDLAVPQPDTNYGGTNDIKSFLSITSKTYLHSFKFSRALNTGDPHDVAITNMDMPMIFATGAGVEPGYHGALNRAHASVNFHTGTVTVADGAAHGLFKLNVFHGVTMYIGFGFVYPVGIYIARYWKDSGSWVSYHQMLMGAVTTEIVFSALLGVIGEFGPIHRRHSILGLFLTGLIIIVTWLGRFSGYWDTEFSVKYNKYIRLAHWTLGYSAYFTGLFQGYMGVVDITEGGNVDWLKWFYIPSVLATPLTLIMVAWWHNFSARKTDGKSTCKQSDNLPKFNWHDVHERVETGAKLLVIKGIVYDAAPFMLKHPGGAKILGSVVGMDATNAFYGIKTRKSKNKQDAQNQAAVPVWHPHSRLAESLLSKLAVGALADDDDNDGDNQGHYGLVKSASMATDGDLESTTDAPTRKAQRLAQLRAISRDHLENKTFKPESLTTQLSELSYQNVELNTRTLASSTESKRPTYRISFKLNSATPEDKKKKEAAQDKANAATVPEVFLFPGQCVILQFITDQGEVVTRQYTPYKSRNVGTIDLYVKMANGLMTRHLKECQSIRIRGPFSHAPEAVNTERKNGCWDAIGMICGGSGLTPMLLIIDYHLRFAARGSPNGRPALQMSLLNINHSDVDMFAQQDLEAAEQRSHGTLSVLNLCHEVKYPAKFKGQQGRVTAELLKKVLPPPSIAPNAGNAGGAPTPAMNASMPGYNRIQSLQMAAGSEGLKGMNRKRAVSPGSATAGDGGFAGFKTSSAMQVKQTPSQQQVAGKRSSAPYAELNQSVSQLFVEVPTTTPRTTTAVERRTSSTGRYNPLPPSDSDESAEDPERQKAMSIFVCGPPPMQAAVLELLLALGYNPDSIVIL